eukprot:gene498-890_t
MELVDGQMDIESTDQEQSSTYVIAEHEVQYTHPMLNWGNVAFSEMELSLNCAEDEAFARVQKGLKPYAQEVCADASAKEAKKFSGRLLRAVSAGTSRTWGETFDLTAIKADYDSLVMPLLTCARSQKVYAAAWQKILGYWWEEQDLENRPVGAHFSAQVVPVIERAILDAHDGDSDKALAAVFGTQPKLARSEFVKRVKAFLGPDIRPSARELFEAATVTGEAATVTGEAATVTGEAATVTGEAVAVTGEAATVTGEAVTVTGEAAMMSKGKDMTIAKKPGKEAVFKKALQRRLESFRAQSEGRMLWDPFEPNGNDELILTGLLFGYPLPSTASLLLVHLLQQQVTLDTQVLRQQANVESEDHLRVLTLGRRFTKKLWEQLQPTAAPYAAHFKGFAVDEVMFDDEEEEAALMLVPGHLYCTDDDRADDLSAVKIGLQESSGIPMKKQRVK